MHPTLVRLPAVVALAASLTVVPAAAFATPPDAVQQGTSSGSDAGAEPQESATGSSTHDMEEMEGADGVDDMEGMPDMEGMDHGGAAVETGDEPAGEHSEHNPSTEDGGGHADAAPPTSRPRVAVLSAFAGVNAVVLGAAAVLRRRDRDRPRHRPRPAATPAAA